MDSATIQILTQVLHHGRMDTGNQVVSALCAACGWAGNNMGWLGLFSGSVGSGVGAGARAGDDGGPSGGSVGPGYRGNRGSGPSPGSYTPTKGVDPQGDPGFQNAQKQLLQHNQLVPDPSAVPTPNPIDTAYHALVNHLQGK
jgi:hypothetical protein